MLVCLLQYGQDRGIRVLQLKLDELIHAVEEGRNDRLRLEEVSDDELRRVQAEFARLRDGSRSCGIRSPATATHGRRDVPFFDESRPALEKMSDATAL